MVAEGADGALLAAVALEVGYELPVCPPISVAVGPGEVLAVVGANGTGKSTLLATVAGRLDPLGGRLDVLGEPVDERSVAFRSAVAVNLGDEAFFPSLSVREHLLLTCYGHGVAAPDDVVDRLLTEFGLDERTEVAPRALSSGQRRRLALASTFARARALLLLDEPEHRLDAGMRRALADRLVQERHDGGAVLLATHDGALVRHAATSVLVLAEGSVAVVGGDEGAAAIDRL